MQARRFLVLTLCGLSLSACATSRVQRQVDLPSPAAAIAAAVITAVPDQAPAIVGAAIKGAPDQAAEITRAAVSIVPGQMSAIVDVAITAAPRQALLIREAAATAMSAEGLASPAPVSRPDDRSGFARRFTNGDEMRFRDLIR